LLCRRRHRRRCRYGWRPGRRALTHPAPRALARAPVRRLRPPSGLAEVEATRHRLTAELARLSDDGAVPTDAELADLRAAIDVRVARQREVATLRAAIADHRYALDGELQRAAADDSALRAELAVLREAEGRVDALR
jgi:hypothetical protein